MEEADALLPGLPDDLAVRCLLPLPASLLRSVNRRWRRLLFSDASFRSLRVALRAPHSTAFFVCVPPNRLISNLAYLCFEVVVVSTSAGHPKYDPPLQYQRRGKDARYLSWDDLLSEKNGCRLVSRLSEHDGQEIFRAGHVCVGLGKWLLVLGRLDFTTKQGSASASVDALDRVTGCWHQRSCMITPRSSSFGAVTYKDRYVFVFGGFSGDDEECLQEVEVYDCVLDSWSPVASIPVPLYIDSSFLYRERMFLQGSAKGSTWSDEHLIYSYDLQLGIWQEERVMAKQLKKLGAWVQQIGASSYNPDKSSTLFREKVVEFTCRAGCCELSEAKIFYKLVGSDDTHMKLHEPGSNPPGKSPLHAPPPFDSPPPHLPTWSVHPCSPQSVVGLPLLRHPPWPHLTPLEPAFPPSLLIQPSIPSNTHNSENDGSRHSDDFGSNDDDYVDHNVWEFMAGINDSNVVQLPAISQDTAINLVLVSSVSLSDYKRVGVSVTQMHSKFFHVELQNFYQCAFAVVRVAP
ncbi:hypothetical protein L7F22_040829 [Adiantum nelumboides]|nr:hypothetical protein [Adiantum nelumboides]